MPETGSLASAPAAGATKVGRPPVITAMTGIRAPAAVWVVATHFKEQLFMLLPSTRVLERWVIGGTLSVDIFFILSGFILSYNYAESLAALDRGKYRAFLAARFARIYPVHLFALLLFAATVAYYALHGLATPRGEVFTLGSFVGNLLMLQAVPGVEPWNYPSWSVGAEAGAYLVFPLFAGLLLRVGRRTGLVLAAVVVLLEMVALVTLDETSLYVFALVWVRVAGGFTLGCLLWAAWRQGVRAHWRWDVIALLAVGATVLVLTFVPRGVYGFLALPFVALFVVAIASTTSFVRAFFASRLVEWAGRMSYSLYLTHGPVMIGLFIWHSPRPYASAPLVVRIAILFGYVSLMLAVAVATYYLIEEPARRWIRRRTAPPPPTYVPDHTTTNRPGPHHENALVADDQPAR